MLSLAASAERRGGWRGPGIESSSSGRPARGRAARRGKVVRLRLAPIVLVLGTLALLTWKRELFTVSRPGVAPAPLRLAEPERRTRPEFDAILPAVPVGMVHLQGSGAVHVVHYWAPWEQHGLAQARALDSLGTLVAAADLRIAIVCFDPFPSVARWVRRAAIRTPVLLDHPGRLAASLPCPSIPYTYVLDRAGRIAVAQPGEVDWLAPPTRALLDSLVRAASPQPAASAGRAL